MVTLPRMAGCIVASHGGWWCCLGGRVVAKESWWGLPRRVGVEGDVA